MFQQVIRLYTIQEAYLIFWGMRSGKVLLSVQLMCEISSSEGERKILLVTALILHVLSKVPIDRVKQRIQIPAQPLPDH